jgi:hypothetical protein
LERTLSSEQLLRQKIEKEEDKEFERHCRWESAIRASLTQGHARAWRPSHAVRGFDLRAIFGWGSRQLPYFADRRHFLGSREGELTVEFPTFYRNDEEQLHTLWRLDFIFAQRINQKQVERLANSRLLDRSRRENARILSGENVLRREADTLVIFAREGGARGGFTLGKTMVYVVIDRNPNRCLFLFYRLAMKLILSKIKTLHLKVLGRSGIETNVPPVWMRRQSSSQLGDVRRAAALIIDGEGRLSPGLRQTFLCLMKVLEVILIGLGEEREDQEAMFITQERPVERVVNPYPPLKPIPRESPPPHEEPEGEFLRERESPRHLPCLMTTDA